MESMQFSVINEFMSSDVDQQMDMDSERPLPEGELSSFSGCFIFKASVKFQSRCSCLRYLAALVVEGSGIADDDDDEAIIDDDELACLLTATQQPCDMTDRDDAVALVPDTCKQNRLHL